MVGNFFSVFLPDIGGVGGGVYLFGEGRDKIEELGVGDQSEDDITEDEDDIDIDETCPEWRLELILVGGD